MACCGPKIQKELDISQAGSLAWQRKPMRCLTCRSMVHRSIRQKSILKKTYHKSSAKDR